MRKTRNTFFLLLFTVLTIWAAPDELKDKLDQMKGVSSIEKLESNQYTEKYLIRITQLVNPKDSSAGTFTQRVVVAHAGFDRPTVIVTEGYGGAYAQRSTYQDELAGLFNANIVHVEHRYFLESTPEPLNWDYLTAENSAYDLHNVTQTFKQIYPEKWISTGISKGGQTVMIYRSHFPDDVDISVLYVAPLCRAVEDGRHEIFLEKEVGTAEERKAIEDYQKEVLRRRSDLVPMLESFSNDKNLTYKISLDELLDFCVLEYPFAFWQWGASVDTIPALDTDNKTVFDHLMKISSPDYFASGQPLESFFVQAARELGYYGYDIKPFEGLISIQSAKGYLSKIMLPESAGDIEFRPQLYHKIYNYLRDNDPKMLFIYGEVDPWSAPRVPDFEQKENIQIYMQPRGSHRARINNMPEDMKEKIITQITAWLEE